MPEIQDVLNKLDDVIEKIIDVQEQVDLLISRNEVWQVCTECAGTGVKFGVTDEVPTEVTCPLCNGTKKIKWGTQEEGA